MLLSDQDALVYFEKACFRKALDVFGLVGN
jgi:hypothetical protein